MRKTTEFNAYAVNYRTKHFAAWDAIDMFTRLDKMHPTEMLALTEVRDSEGGWHSLASPENIERFVRDVTGALLPHQALGDLFDLVKHYNFGFPPPKVDVPRRFRSKVEEDRPGETNPVLSVLFVEGKATWRELQEEYSMEDAFKMHSVLIEAKVKAAKEEEQARIEAKAKAKERR